MNQSPPQLKVTTMAVLTIDVPDAFIAAAGSDEALRVLILRSVAAELVRSGKATVEELAPFLENSLDQWMQLVATGDSIKFWSNLEQDIYTLADGSPV